MGWNPFRARRERRLAALAAWRTARRLADEDVTVFGEELARLHEETLTTPLTDEMAADYQRALDLYERAKVDLRTTETVTDVAAVDRLLEEGRFHLARVLALRDGVEPPTRHDPCFFNPQHGPAVVDVPWTPPGGVERLVPVCRRDRERLEGGEQPDIRRIRVGDRWVSWWEAASIGGDARTATVASYAGTGYSAEFNAHLMEAEGRRMQSGPGGLV